MESKQPPTETRAGAGGHDVDTSTFVKRLVLSLSDVNLLRGLDEEYNNVVHETEVEIRARMIWAFRSAVASVCMMAIYLATGVIFLSWQTDWKLLDTMLFCVYTVTSAGYGHVEIPKTALVQIFLIFYIMFGIANLAVVVAQVYQYATLRASRLLARASRQKTLQSQKRREHDACDNSTLEATCMGKAELTSRRPLIDRLFQELSKFMDYLNHTDAGQVLSVVLPLLAMHLSGSIAIGVVEGWNFREILYYGIVSMTTVGYGDYVPSTNAGIIICLFWLPCNIAFVSIYMTGVAKAYFVLARKSISRIEKHLKLLLATEQKLDQPLTNNKDKLKDKIIDLEAGGEPRDHMDQHLKPSSSEPNDEASEQDQTEGETGKEDVNDDKIACNVTREIIHIQAENDDILKQVPVNENQYVGFSSYDNGTLETMADVIEAVHAYSKGTLTSDRNDGTGRPLSSRHLQILFLPNSSSTQHTCNEVRHLKLRSSGKEKPLRSQKPCFVMRVMAKERLARIIARELVGSHLTVEMQDDNAISVKLGKIKEISGKWLIPIEARQSFRAVAFEALLYVGEKTLLEHGAKALFDLKPDEFHRIFSPLLAQMGDADTFEAWLANTEELAKRELSADAFPDTEHDLYHLHRKLVIVDNLGKLPTNIGNAFQK